MPRKVGMLNGSARHRNSSIKNSGFGKAVLLIRWSSSSDVKEVRQAQEAFRADTEIHVWEASDSEDLLDATQRWAMSGRAQVLYIGAHGLGKG